MCRRLRKNPLADGNFLPRPQQRRDAFRQDDHAVALARFRVAEGVDALPLAVQRPGDSERPGLRVEVAPHERADLAAPQAGHMTCTTGCVGGAGQPIGRKEQKYARAKVLYEADRKTLIKSSQHNPILNALYQKITTEEAHHLLHVHYPGEDAQA